MPGGDTQRNAFSELAPRRGIRGGKLQDWKSENMKNQKNIIGDRVLGLPREPSVDKGVPFKELRVGTQKET